MAVLINKDDEEELYFALETKGSILADELRLRKNSKISCIYRHFEALGNLGNDVDFKPVNNYGLKKVIEDNIEHIFEWEHGAASGYRVLKSIE